MIIYMWSFPDSFGARFWSSDGVRNLQWGVLGGKQWMYQPREEDHPPYHHTHHPLWGKSVILGAFIASGGDW